MYLLSTYPVKVQLLLIFGSTIAAVMIGFFLDQLEYTGVFGWIVANHTRAQLLAFVWLQRNKLDVETHG